MSGTHVEVMVYNFCLNLGWLQGDNKKFKIKSFLICLAFILERWLVIKSFGRKSYEKNLCILHKTHKTRLVYSNRIKCKHPQAPKHAVGKDILKRL